MLVPVFMVLTTFFTPPARMTIYALLLLPGKDPVIDRELPVLTLVLSTTIIINCCSSKMFLALIFHDSTL